MKTLSATEASRGFSAMLDAVEHDGEVILIERDGRPIARVSPEPKYSGARLMAWLTENRADDPLPDTGIMDPPDMDFKDFLCTGPGFPPETLTRDEDQGRIIKW